MRNMLLLFGTGKMAEEYSIMLEQLGIEIFGYIDNDKAKWGSLFHGKEVYDCEVLEKLPDYKILIACSAREEVTNQLKEIGKLNKIISLYDVINMASLVIENENDLSNEQTVIIDNLSGTWGGAEDWVHIIATSLIERGTEVFIVEGKEAITKEELYTYTYCIDKNAEGLLKKLIVYLLGKRPLVVINIWSSELLWAAAYVKKIYPKDVRIVSALLADTDFLYRKQCAWESVIDRFLCISSRINDKLIDVYGIERERVYKRVPFAEKRLLNNRSYHIDRKIPLAIVYPCRLETGQKRADLLPILIGMLEEKNVNYVFNIVGEGSCKEGIIKYVADNNLSEKVMFLGRLEREKLIDFLGRQDVYLNISEYEGTSLTMLEALASGCVPVVTDVSGVNDFIINRENGFISEIGDLEDIAESIGYIDKNRCILMEYGKRCRCRVERDCRLDDYVDYIENLLQFEM